MTGHSANVKTNDYANSSHSRIWRRVKKRSANVNGFHSLLVQCSWLICHTFTNCRLSVTKNSQKRNPKFNFICCFSIDEFFLNNFSRSACAIVHSTINKTSILVFHSITRIVWFGVYLCVYIVSGWIGNKIWNSEEARSIAKLSSLCLYHLNEEKSLLFGLWMVKITASFIWRALIVYVRPHTLWNAPNSFTLNPSRSAHRWTRAFSMIPNAIQK